MAKVYAAKTYDNKTIDVVLALSKSLANAYWHGKGVTPHHVRCYSNIILEQHPTGVIPIVSTETKMIMNASCTKEQEYFVIK